MKISKKLNVKGIYQLKKQLVMEIKISDCTFEKKPSYDIFIDDKCYGFKKDWLMKMQKNLKI